jgi:hypothetical protein
MSMPLDAQSETWQPKPILWSILAACVFVFVAWLLTDWLMDYPSLHENTLLMIFSGPCLWYPLTHKSIAIWSIGVLLAYLPVGFAVAKRRFGWRAIAWTIGLWIGQGLLLSVA